MTRFEFLVDVRQRLISEISGTKDAGSFLYWDDTRPNWSTQRSVNLLFDEARKSAEKFGVYVVQRHGNCGRRTHRDYFVYMPIAGHSIRYDDPEFIVADVLDQGEWLCACPCSRNPTEIRHTVLIDVIYAKSADSTFCNAMTSILSDIYRAMKSAGNKRPRSGIREYLLRAMLKTNDLILPQSVDAYIAEQSGDSLGLKDR